MLHVYLCDFQITQSEVMPYMNTLHSLNCFGHVIYALPTSIYEVLENFSFTRIF